MCHVQFKQKRLCASITTNSNSQTLSCRSSDEIMEMILTKQAKQDIVKALKDSGMSLVEAKSAVEDFVENLEKYVTEDEKAKYDIASVKAEFATMNTKSSCMLLILVALSPLLAYMLY